MLKTLLKKWFKSHSKTNNISEIDYDAIPVMDGESLIHYLEQTNRIRAISRKVMIDKARFEHLYLKPINRFCELVQLSPASQAYHHSFVGGLIIHTLAVAEIAVHERQKYNLPLGADPEILEEERNVWTYAVFASALFHDIGKIYTMCNFVDVVTEKPISLFRGSLFDQGIDNYKIRFNSSENFSLHQKLGAIFVSIILDNISLTYLSSKPHIFKEFLAYIDGDKYEWGSIGNILSVADQQSTANALKITSKSRQFPGAILENFGERLMNALRFILNNKSISKNRPGATFWITQKHTYAVAKTFAEMLREEMVRLGSTDIPTDNTRIFDELQNYDFCETTPSGGAIFSITIETESGFKQDFTCVKINNSRLYPANKTPTPLNGTISEIIHKKNKDNTLTNQSLEDDFPPVGLVQANKSPPSQGEQKKAPLDKTDNPFPVLGSVKNVIGAGAETDDNHPKLETSSRETIISFFNWLDDKTYDHNTYTINKDGPIHTVEYENEKVLGIMSPVIFIEYARDIGILSETHDFNEGKNAATLIQKAFHTEKINIGVAGQQVHYYKKTNSVAAKVPKLSFYLIPISKITNERFRSLISDTDIRGNLEKYYKKH